MCKDVRTYVQIVASCLLIVSAQDQSSAIYIRSTWHRRSYYAVNSSTICVKFFIGVPFWVPAGTGSLGKNKLKTNGFFPRKRMNGHWRLLLGHVIGGDLFSRLRSATVLLLYFLNKKLAMLRTHFHLLMAISVIPGTKCCVAFEWLAI